MGNSQGSSSKQSAGSPSYRSRTNTSSVTGGSSRSGTAFGASPSPVSSPASSAASLSLRASRAPAHPLDRFVQSTGLYPEKTCTWAAKYHEQMRQMIITSAIAPRVKGFDDAEPDVEALECPVCMLYYCLHAVNTTTCCKSPICSECFFHVQKPDFSVSCPFCKRDNFRVLYSSDPAPLLLPTPTPTPTPTPSGPSSPTQVYATSDGKAVSPARPSPHLRIMHVRSSVTATGCLSAEEREALTARRIVFATEEDRKELCREIHEQEGHVREHSERERARSRGASAGVGSEVSAARAGSGAPPAVAAAAPAAPRVPTRGSSRAQPAEDDMAFLFNMLQMLAGDTGAGRSSPASSMRTPSGGGGFGSLFGGGGGGGGSSSSSSNSNSSNSSSGSASPAAARSDAAVASGVTGNRVLAASPLARAAARAASAGSSASTESSDGSSSSTSDGGGHARGMSAGRAAHASLSAASRAPGSPVAWDAPSADDDDMDDDDRLLQLALQMSLADVASPSPFGVSRA